MDDLRKQTDKNVQEKANLIWNIATHLVGLYKPHQYGNVILPFAILKRFDDTLKKTKTDVVKKARELQQMSNLDENLKEGVLLKTSGYDFYNISSFDFEKLLGDPDNIESNFNDYLLGFSDNIKDIISNFKLTDEIKTLSENGKLFIVIQEFNSEKADMSPDKVTSTDMGYIFEELVRKFSESYDEQAGAHFTARDIIYLMTELLVAPERDDIAKNGCAKTAYDMAMGTSQMLGCLDEKLKEINSDSNLMIFGQELNPQTYAIAKADALIKGKNASNMRQGDTLIKNKLEENISNGDQFEGYEFDYIISNPPFGIDWKSEEKSVKDEYKLGYEGRFGPGLPAIGDGQMLFMLNGIKKLKDTGRMAIIQNGSSLFNGDAGSGPSNIRGFLLEPQNDYLEAIIQLPNDLFYNTGIATYIWVITKNKPLSRKGRVQLIDASKCYIKRRKNIGNKRVDLTDKCISLIVKAYNEFEEDKEYNENGLAVSSKVFDNAYFGYTKVVVETAEVDDKDNEIIKKGKKVAAKGKSDIETIPLIENVDTYFEKNVLPFNKHAFMDRSKDKVGYEIPFTKIFYKFVEPRKSEEIFEEFKELSKQEQELMRKILGE